MLQALKSEFEKKANFLTDVSESTLDKCSEPKHFEPPRELSFAQQNKKRYLSSE